MARAASGRVGGKNMMEMGTFYATVIFVQILNIQLYRFFESSGLNNKAKMTFEDDY